MGACDFLSNRTRVLLLIGQDPNSRIQDLAATLNLTVSAIQRLVKQLEADNYLSRGRIGRRNAYRINREKRIDELGLSLGELLDLVALRRSAPAQETAPVQPAARRKRSPE